MPDARPHTHTPKDALKHIALLDLCAGLVLVGFVAAFGLRGAFGPYIDELGAFTRSMGTIVFYTLAVVAYAVLVEVVLRGLVQTPAARRFGPLAGGAAATLLYILLHLRYGWMGGAYALGVGAASAWIYARSGQRVWVMVLWHVQWDLLAIGVAFSMALAGPGVMRDAVNHAHKTHLVRAGRLQHLPGWGWVDTSHYHGAQRRMCAIHQHLRDHPGEPVWLKGVFARADGSLIHLSESFAPTPELSPDRHLQEAARLALLMARRDEEAQASAGFFSALQISAWNFDDLPSVQRAALDALSEPDFVSRCEAIDVPTPEGFEVPRATADPALNTARWDKEGRERVREDHATLDLPARASEADRRAYEAVWVTRRP